LAGILVARSIEVALSLTLVPASARLTRPTISTISTIILEEKELAIKEAIISLARSDTGQCNEHHHPHHQNRGKNGTPAAEVFLVVHAVHALGFFNVVAQRW
jgi:hypothetical protein